MPSTANFNLPYPSPQDAPDGASQIRALAEAVDEALVLNDTGTQTNMGLQIASGWQLIEKVHRVIGKICFFRLYVTRTGSTLTGVGGNLADTLIATITDPALRPAFFQVAVLRASATGGTVQLSDVTGDITLVDIHTSGEIETGENAQMNFVYPLP